MRKDNKETEDESGGEKDSKQGLVGQETGVILDWEGDREGSGWSKKNFLDSTALLHAKDLGREGSWRV